MAAETAPTAAIPDDVRVAATAALALRVTLPPRIVASSRSSTATAPGRKPVAAATRLTLPSMDPLASARISAPGRSAMLSTTTSTSPAPPPAAFRVDIVPKTKRLS